MPVQGREDGAGSLSRLGLEPGTSGPSCGMDGPLRSTSLQTPGVRSTKPRSHFQLLQNASKTIRLTQPWKNPRFRTCGVRLSTGYAWSFDVKGRFLVDGANRDSAPKISPENLLLSGLKWVIDKLGRMGHGSLDFLACLLFFQISSEGWAVV